MKEDWYKDKNELKKFDEFITDTDYQYISNFLWNAAGDCDGCYMGTAMNIQEETFEIAIACFKLKIKPQLYLNKMNKIDSMLIKDTEIDGDFENPKWSPLRLMAEVNTAVHDYEKQYMDEFKIYWQEYLKEKQMQAELDSPSADGVPNNG